MQDLTRALMGARTPRLKVSLLRQLAPMLALVVLPGCGGGGGSQNASTYSLSAGITGLTSNGLVLLVNGASVSVSNGSSSASLATGLGSGTAYTVSVSTQPAGQTCLVANGSGAIASANVTNITVTCYSNHTVSGGVSGLNASGLVLANGTDTLSVPSGAASFTMPTSVGYTNNYSVTVRTQPTGETCTIVNGAGTMGLSDVINVGVSCVVSVYTIGGQISGLKGSGLVLQNNGVDDLSVSSDATSFTMATGITHGSGYTITLKSQPLLMRCTVGNGNGTATAPVTTISVSCVDHVTETVLRSFPAGSPVPPAMGDLLAASDGALYGMTYSDGTNSFGTVFKINKDGSSYTVLHNFTGGSSHDSGPMGNLIEGSDGNLYGMTVNSGAAGFGTVFKISKSGAYQLMHSFSGGLGGAEPYGSLVEGGDGKLYGMTQLGGSADMGTVFSMSKDGTSFSVTHSFVGDSTDGALPMGNLTQGSDGYLYGMARSKGAHNDGVIFKVSKDGSSYSILHDFQGVDGLGPLGSLIQGSDGLLYGMAFSGGTIGYGVIFKLSTAGVFSKLHDFTIDDGANPHGTLVEGSDGNLYGLTLGGGSGADGAAFRISKTGTYSLLYSFAGNDGKSPLGSLIGSSDGSLYGMTNLGGISNNGTVFSLSGN